MVSVAPENLVGTDVLVTLIRRPFSGKNLWEEHITGITEEGIFVGNCGWIPFVGGNVGIKEIRDATGTLRYENPRLEEYLSSFNPSDMERARIRSYGGFYPV